jgi:hypothetical protein
MENELSKRGQALVDLLWDFLKRDTEHKDRRHTGFGTKTKIGLVASIERIIDESAPVAEPSNVAEQAKADADTLARQPAGARAIDASIDKLKAEDTLTYTSFLTGEKTVHHRIPEAQPDPLAEIVATVRRETLAGKVETQITIDNLTSDEARLYALRVKQSAGFSGDCKVITRGGVYSVRVTTTAAK